MINIFASCWMTCGDKSLPQKKVQRRPERKKKAKKQREELLFITFWITAPRICIPFVLYIMLLNCAFRVSSRQTKLVTMFPFCRINNCKHAKILK